MLFFSSKGAVSSVCGVPHSSGASCASNFVTICSLRMVMNQDK